MTYENTFRLGDDEEELLLTHHCQVPSDYGVPKNTATNLIVVNEPAEVPIEMPAKEEPKEELIEAPIAEKPFKGNKKFRILRTISGIKSGVSALNRARKGTKRLLFSTGFLGISVLGYQLDAALRHSFSARSGFLNTPTCTIAGTEEDTAHPRLVKFPGDNTPTKIPNFISRRYTSSGPEALLRCRDVFNHSQFTIYSLNVDANFMVRGLNGMNGEVNTPIAGGLREKYKNFADAYGHDEEVKNYLDNLILDQSQLQQDWQGVFLDDAWFQHQWLSGQTSIKNAQHYAAAGIKNQWRAAVNWTYRIRNNAANTIRAPEPTLTEDPSP